MALLHYLLVTIATVSASLELPERILESYNRCRLDPDCTKISSNSFCYGNDQQTIGKCKCAAGYELLERNRTHFSCLQKTGFEEPCQESIQCQISLGSEAVCEGTCKCSDKAHRFKDGRCYKSILLGDICISDGECWMDDGSFGNCVYGKCSCKFNRQVPNAQRSNCINARNLGESCREDSECQVVEDTVCREVCKCSVGYTLSRNETRCLKGATRFGEHCGEADQCSAFLEGSICTNNICSCPDNYHSFGSRCVPTALIGQLCYSQSECAPNVTYFSIVNCIDGVCQCLPGAVNDYIGCSANSVHWLNILSVMTAFSLTYLIYY